MKSLYATLLCLLIAAQGQITAQGKNHLSSNLFSMVSTKGVLGMTYHRELTKNWGLQLGLFRTQFALPIVLNNLDFTPDFTYQIIQERPNLGGEFTLYFYDNLIGVYAGYENFNVRKNECFCTGGAPIDEWFYRCDNFQHITYNDRIHIFQTGLRFVLPLFTFENLAEMKLHLRPMYARYWNNENAEIPAGADLEDRDADITTVGRWNNNLIFRDKGSYVSFKIELHVGLTW